MVRFKTYKSFRILTDPLNRRSFVVSLLLVIGLTAGVRSAVLFMMPDRFQADPDAYRAIAVTINQSGVFGLTNDLGVARPIAFRPPLYPFLLSFGVVNQNVGQQAEIGGRNTELSPSFVSVLHIGLAMVTSVCVFLATLRLVELMQGIKRSTLGLRMGLAAAGLTVIDPILIRQSTELMTETLAGCLAAAAVYCWIRAATAQHTQSSLAWSVMLSVAIALAFLGRPTFLVWGILLVVAVLAGYRNRCSAIGALILSVGIMIAVGGWTLRNIRTLGAPVWATTHGGYTLLLANNEPYYDYLSKGEATKPWDAQPFLNAYQHRYEGDPRTVDFWRHSWTGKPNFDNATSEVDDDRLNHAAAMSTIKRRPMTFLWSSVVRVSRLWSPFPQQTTNRSRFLRFAVGSYYTAIYAAIMIAFVRFRGRLLAKQWWAIWLLLFSLSGVHAVYWSNLRMRAPAMPALAIVAVFAVVPASRHAGKTGLP